VRLAAARPIPTRIRATDPQRARRTDPGRPEVCNVFTLHRLFGTDNLDQIDAACRSAQIGCVDCKQTLATTINDYFEPIRARRDELAANPKHVDDVLQDGAQRARIIAKEVLADVKARVGLPPAPI